MLLPPPPLNTGDLKIPSNTLKQKGINFTVDLSAYVDDTVFIFEKKEDLIKGTRTMIKQCKRIGLIVHIGKEGKTSKTEYMFIPPYKTETNQFPLE